MEKRPCSIVVKKEHVRKKGERRRGKRREGRGAGEKKER